MKILKYLLFLVLLVFIGTAIYFGTKDGSYEIRDSIKIAAPSEVVFEKINHLETWKDWFTLYSNDKKLIFSSSEISSGEGATVNWDGDGRGTVITKKVIPNREIDQEMIYKTSTKEKTTQIHWEFNDLDEETEVVWVIQGEYGFFEKLQHAWKKSNPSYEMRLQKEKSLENLSELIKQDLEKYSIHVDGVVHYGGGYYMYTTTSARENEVQEKMVSMLSSVKDFLDKNNIPVTGKPFIIFNQTDPMGKSVIFSACYPVGERIITPDSGNIVSGFMDPISAVKTTLAGKYKNLVEARNAGRNYIKSEGYERDPDHRRFEIYRTSEIDSRNPAEWVTEIYFPVLPMETTDLDFD